MAPIIPPGPGPDRPGGTGPSPDRTQPVGRIPPGPPFDIEVLSDLHAGVYPDAVAAVLRARVAADPESAAVLEGLDRVVADLRDLPATPIPRQVADRLDAVIAAEVAGRSTGPAAPGPAAGSATGPAAGSAAPPPGPQGQPAPAPSSPPPSQPQRQPQSQPQSQPQRQPQRQPHDQPPPGVTSLDQARARRTRPADRARRQTRWATGLGIAAAAAAVFTIGAVALRPASTGGEGMAGAPPTLTSASSEVTASEPTQPGAGAAPPGNAEQEPPSAGQQPSDTHAVVADPNHLTDLLPQIEGSDSTGPLSDPDRLAACLAANDAAGQQVLGVLPVTYTGQAAYAISLRADADTIRILVVGPACGVDGAHLLDEQTIPG